MTIDIKLKTHLRLLTRAEEELTVLESRRGVVLEHIQKLSQPRVRTNILHYKINRVSSC